MLKLSEIAFANSIALLTAAFYLLFYLINLIAPGMFRFLFNAQFLGADVASLLPKEFAAGNFIIALVLMVIIAWIFGYVWAWLYNRLAK
jgi:2TM family of unknown function (DUF5676)